jgi:hypothetical protein
MNFSTAHRKHSLDLMPGAFDENAPRTSLPDWATPVVHCADAPRMARLSQ